MPMILLWLLLSMAVLLGCGYGRPGTCRRYVTHVNMCTANQLQRSTMHTTEQQQQQPTHRHMSARAAKRLTSIMTTNLSTTDFYEKNWVDSSGNAQTVLDPESLSEVSIVSWNVLGPLHGESQKHSYAEQKVVMWSKRRENLLADLRSLNADIMCLQEVSEKALKETFIPGLRHIGLECSGYAPMLEQGRHRGKYAHKSVGCAVFVRTSKLNVLSSKRVHLKDFFPTENCFSHQFAVDVLGKLNPMVMMLVKSKATNQPFVIANTHLFWNPDRTDIKSTQGYLVTQALDAFIENIKKDDSLTKDDAVAKIFSAETNLPLVLCGDFNSFPECSRSGPLNPSGLFELFQTGRWSLQPFFVQFKN
jgi:mRNA deadenylase 3'-5' endonuclease subunit Ccr4